MDNLGPFDKRLTEICNRLFELQNEKLATVFIDFSGHVNWIRITVCPCGWKDLDHEKTETWEMLPLSNDAYESLKSFLNNARLICSELRSWKL